MKRVVASLCLLACVACDNKSSSTSAGGNARKPGDIDMRPTVEKPETPEEVQKSKAFAAKLVGRWRNDAYLVKEYAPKRGFKDGYELKADGTYQVLDKDGKPVAGETGTWEIFHGEERGGFMTLKGKGAPEIEKFLVDIDNPDILHVSVPGPDPKNPTEGAGAVDYRRQKP